MPKHDPTEKTKSEIISTAARLFKEKGWDKVNIEDIVKEVGVTRGAFYHYFKSREALIVAVVDQMFYDDNSFALASMETGLNALEKLRFAFKHNLNFNYDHGGLTKELAKVFDDPVIFKSECLSQINVVAPYVEKLIREGNEDGSMSVKYPKQAAEVLALLPSVWISPFAYKISRQEFLDKILFMGQLMESIGIPIMNDELTEIAIKLVDDINY